MQLGKKIKEKYYIVLLFVISLISYNCETKKALIIDKEILNSRRLYKKYTNIESDFEKLLVKKLSIKYQEKDKKLNINGSLAIFNDSLINIRITPLLGIQAYNVLITKDSVKVVDRIKRIVYKDEFYMIKKILNHEFSFEDLQSLFINNIKLSNDFKKIEILNKKTEIYDGLHLIKIVDSSNKLGGAIDRRYYINNHKNRIDKFEYYDTLKNSIKISYDDYFIESKIQIPKMIDILMLNNKEYLKVKLVYNKILVNNNFKINFKIPKNYEVKSLKSL